MYDLTGDAPGSISQPKIAFSPCSSNCEGKCVDTCPDYCCVQTIKSKTSDQSNQVGVLQASQVSEISSFKSISMECRFNFTFSGVSEATRCPEICLGSSNIAITIVQLRVFLVR